MTKARDIATGGIDNSITASKLDVSGNGTAGQLLKSDGDGSFTWVDSPEPFQATTVSGTTHTLDLSSANYFNGGTTTGNTTLAFSNVPTAKTWSYDITMGGVSTTTDLISIADTPSSTTTAFSSQGTNNSAHFLKSDGTKVYWFDESGGNIYQYSLSTPYDLSTISYDSVSIATSGSARGLAFKSDGTKLYYIHAGTYNLVTWNLSTGWDLSTATFGSNTSISSSVYSTIGGGLSFKPDGTKMYSADYQSGIPITLREWTLSTAWDASTISSTSIINFTTLSVPTYAVGNGCGDVQITSDGLTLYVMWYGAWVSRFTLSTAWDITTASFTDQFKLNDEYGQTADSLAISRYTTSGTDDDRYFLIGFDDEAGRMFDAVSATPHTFTYPASVQNPTDIISTMEYQDKYKLEFITTDGGTTVWKTGHNKYQDN